MTLLRHFSLLSKAINEEETPTPGYLYVDIAKITHESLNTCRELEDYLLKKLQKPSPVVKTKTLQVGVGVFMGVLHTAAARLFFFFFFFFFLIF